VTCETVLLPGGGHAIVCIRRRRPPKCSVPGCDAPAAFQCDAPAPRRKTGTCDRHLCASHRTPQGPGVDFCPEHAYRSAQPSICARDAPNAS
jgi:hypothetical protein